jgi:hypothetical protein
MKLFPKQNSDFLIEMTKNEFFIIRGVLSHLTLKSAMGRDYDIIQSTGWNETQIFLLLTKIKESYQVDKQSCMALLSEEEIIFLQKAIEDTTSFIGQEFSILIGRTIDEALTVKDSFSKILKLAKS